GRAQAAGGTGGVSFVPGALADRGGGRPRLDRHIVLTDRGRRAGWSHLRRPAGHLGNRRQHGGIGRPAISRVARIPGHRVGHRVGAQSAGYGLATWNDTRLGGATVDCAPRTADLLVPSVLHLLLLPP